MKMYELLGERKSIKDWCEYFDMPYATVCYRLGHGYDLVDALTTEKNARKKKPEVKLAEKNGISYRVYYNRVKKLGWDKKQAATVPKGSIKRGRKKKETPVKAVTPVDPSLEMMMSIWKALNETDKMFLLRVAEVTLEAGGYGEKSA